MILNRQLKSECSPLHCTSHEWYRHGLFETERIRNLFELLGFFLGNKALQQKTSQKGTRLQFTMDMASQEYVLILKVHMIRCRFIAGCLDVSL